MNKFSNMLLTTILILGFCTEWTWGQQFHIEKGSTYYFKTRKIVGNSKPDQNTPKGKLFQYEGKLLSLWNKETEAINIDSENKHITIYFDSTWGTVIRAGIKNVSGLPIPPGKLIPDLNDTVSVKCEGSEENGRIICTLLEIYAHR